MSTVNPFNQYSFVIIAGFGLLTLAVVFAVTGFNRRKAAALAAAAAAGLVAWAGLRTGAGSAPEAVQAALVVRAADRPVLVEFYSDYCVACLAAKPTLDALERELRSDLRIIRLDVASAEGRALGEQLELRVTPTFILFDADGLEIWRGLGSLDGGAIRAALGLT